MLLVIFLAGAILWNLPWSKYDNVLFVSAVEPGYLDFDNLPDTNFSCEGKVIGGYYADTETGCQMFHVCTIGQKSEITDIKFLCLNGTVFDQETRVCERLDEVDCSKSESFFDLNLELYGNNGGGYGIQPEDDGKEQEAEHCEDEYEDDENANSCHKKAHTNGTEHNKEAEYADWDESTPAAPVSQLPSTSSTSAPTTARPTVTSSSSPRPTSPPPKFLYQRPEFSRPPTTADTSLQLLALHESFQQNIKQQEASKLRPINVAPAAAAAAAAARNSTAFSFSKMPPPYPMFPPPSGGPPSAAPSPPRPASSFYSLPSKLPNTLLSNLSQKPSLASSLANSNRTPPGSSASPFAVNFKTEPAGYFGGSNGNKHSQRVTLPPAQSLPAGVKVQQPPKQEPAVLFSYKILGGGDSRPDRFRPSNTVQYNFASNPVTDASSAFKVEAGGGLAHPTFVAIAQNRPFTFRPQPGHAAQFTQHHQRNAVDDDADEAPDAATSQAKSAEYESHTNFARAIADRPKNGGNGSDAAAVSVVLRTSSVSSSISSKPPSAILNSSTHPIPPPSASNVRHRPNEFGAAGQKGGFGGSPHQSFVSTLRSNTLGVTSSMRPNITEINEALTEEPYYEEEDEGANIEEYDENSPEYKDIAYPSDVHKIRQR